MRHNHHLTFALLLLSVLLPAAAQTIRLKAVEARRYLPLTRFYETPVPLPPGKPGELIRAQPFSSYDLRAAASAVRILYHSRSANGAAIAVSGVVLVPTGKPPAGGWPIIAWAHGFSGVARQCAPSLMRNLEHGPFLSMYVKLGYAVVATDYAGLGATSPNAFADMKSNATDVLNSVLAARSAVPQLGSRWVALGEAEGGMAVAALAELEKDIHDPNYLGAIAISGVANLGDVYDRIAQGSSAAKLAFLAYGIKAVFPQFQPSEILGEKALAFYQQIETSCAEALQIPALPASQLVKPNWQKSQAVRDFFARNRLGETPAYGPLLVIAGDADTRILPGMTAQAVARMCRRGDRIQFDQYPNLDGGQVVGESAQEQIGWLQARFAGIKAPSNCH